MRLNLNHMSEDTESLSQPSGLKLVLNLNNERMFYHLLNVSRSRYR